MSVKILYLINLLDALGMALVIPLINPHVQTLGGSLSVVGVLTSLSSGAQLFSSPVVGSWSDTRGRKLLLLSTLCLVFVSNALSGISSLGFFFVGRILYGIAHQTDPLVRTIIADKVPQNQLTDTFNKLMAIGGFAFIVAPVLGGLLYGVFKSFSYISVILCTLDVITISITFFFIEEQKTKDDASEKKMNQKNSFMQSISEDLSKVFADLKNVDWSRYGDLLAIKFFAEAALSLLFTNMGVILMQTFSFSQTQMGLSIAYLSIVMIGSTFLSGVLSKTLYKSDETGFQRTSQGFVTLLIFFCTLPFANTPLLYLSVYLPLIIAKTLIDSTWMEVLSKRTTEKDKGVMMGAATSMLSLAGLVCPLIGGFTGDYVGVDALFMLPIIPAFFGVLLVNKAKHPIEKVD